jgi:hypothetical protein
LTLDRPVLIHYHIFKNAGTSIDDSLQRSFGDRWTAFEGTHATDVIDAARLSTFLSETPHLVAVSSHLARPPLPWSTCRPIVFVRHPIDRARSVFDFIHADATQPGSELARTLGFAGYIRWVLDGGRGGIVIRDYQTVHLSEASFRDGSVLDARPTERDLAQALELLEGWGVAGVVDRYDASVAVFQALYGPDFPDLMLDTVWLNRTQQSTRTLAERIADARSELGDELFDRLENANRLDLRLYHSSVARLSALCAAHSLSMGATDARP